MKRKKIIIDGLKGFLWDDRETWFISIVCGVFGGLVGMVIVRLLG